MTDENYNAKELVTGHITVAHVTALTWSFQKACGMLADGKLGPKTRNELDKRRPEPNTIDSAPVDSTSEQGDEWGIGFDGPLRSIPRSRADIYETFGNPGTAAKPDKKWKKQNIVTVRDLPGVPPKWYFKCHKLAEPYFREGLRRASTVSEYKIDRAASFVLRHIRHDPSRPLSLHSWGIAIDIDPARNKGKTFKRGECPEPWSEEWLKIWPNGVDSRFVVAMESVGLTWGGVWGRSGDDIAERAKRVTYTDSMHFELRLR